MKFCPITDSIIITNYLLEVYMHSHGHGYGLEKQFTNGHGRTKDHFRENLIYELF